MKTIVLDTNIWLSELALMKPMGCAFSHYIKKRDFKIGLPEVIEEEVKQNFRNDLHKYRSNIQKDYNRMLAIFGKMKEIVMPTDQEIKERVDVIFDFHKDRLIRIPFDIKGARSSFDKIIKKEPPNSEKIQQFKDGVIWANCIELAKSNEVIFLTNDRDFFEERKYENGLANNLAQEAQILSNKIIVFNELSRLLKEIKCDLDLDEKQLVKLIEAKTYKNILEASERSKFSVGKLISSKFEVFATTNPKEVSIKFSLEYSLKNESTKYRNDLYAESRGELLLDYENYEIKNFVNLGEYEFWKNENGELKEACNYHCDGNIVLGHKTIEHQAFRKLR